MSMLIIGANPPKSCYACSWYNKVECPVNDGRYYYRAQRHPSCPLIELPPHSRLIDATFEENHYASMLLDPTPDVTEQDKHKARIIIEALRMAGTVVEAEGSET